MKTILTILFLFLCASLGCASTTYYVTTTGSTLGDGSIGSPWSLIQTGVNALSVPGDMLCVGNGNYNEQVVLSLKSGTAGNDITMKNCSGGAVNIDYGENIVSWTLVGTNVYESNPLTTVGRTFLWKDISVSMQAKQSNCNSLSAGQWCVNGNSVRIYSTSNPTSTYTMGLGFIPLYINKSGYITIEGIGSKYSQNGTTVGQYGASNAGAINNITIKNSEHAYAGGRNLRVVCSSASTVQDVTIDSVLVHGTTNSLDSGNQHCIKFDSDTDGNVCSNGAVSNSTIYNCANHGLQYSDGWYNGTFHHLRIYNFDTGGSFGYGIRCGESKVAVGGSNSCNIYNNNIGDDGNGGKSNGDSIGIEDYFSVVNIYKNYLHDVNEYNIVMRNNNGHNPNNINIWNNVFRGSVTRSISGQNIVSWLNILNNTFYLEGGSPIISLSSGTLGQFKNNIEYSNSSSPVMWSFPSGFVSDYNVYRCSSGTCQYTYANVTYTGLPALQLATGQDTHSVETNQSANAMFQFTNNDNLKLLSGSAGLAIGTDLSIYFTDDYIGLARVVGGWDAGAYQVTIPPPLFPGENRINGATISGFSQ